MVGADHLDGAALEAAPERLLVLGRAERRAHDMVGRAAPVGVAVDGVVDHQVLHERLAEHAVAGQLGPRDGLHGLPTAGVHHIERHAHHAGDLARAVGRLAFHVGAARERVTFGAVDAALEDLVLHAEDQVAVLGVHQADGAQVACTLEAGDQGGVVHHDGVLVGHEVLEAVHAVVAAERGHLVEDLRAPPGDRHVEAVVGGGLPGPLAPRLVRLEHGLLRRRNAEVDDHGGAARRGARRAAEEVVHAHRAHEGQFHVHMRVDAAGHHVGAARVDHLCAGRGLQAFAHGRDPLARDQHVAAPLALRRDDGSAANQRGVAHEGLTGA